MTLKYVLSVPSGAPDAEKLPLVIVLHGRGADANDLADLAPYIDNGYRFVFPNAPRPFEPMPGMSFGYTWFDGLPPEQASLEASRTLMLQFIDEIVGKYPTSKLVLAGFSQGAMMSLDVPRAALPATGATRRSVMNLSVNAIVDGRMNFAMPQTVASVISR